MNIRIPAGVSTAKHVILRDNHHEEFIKSANGFLKTQRRVWTYCANKCDDPFDRKHAKADIELEEESELLFAQKLPAARCDVGI